MLWWFACNVHDSDVSEYSTTNTSNSSISKYYIVKKKTYDFPDSNVSE
jgi:hypothetical protein